MAWSPWKSPQQARQLETDEIDLVSQIAHKAEDFVSARPVKSISTSFGTFIREESNSVVFTDWGFELGAVEGIEVRIQAARVARIQDKTVQLWDGTKTVGENLADLSAGDDHVYGSASDRWGVPASFGFPLDSSDFGVVIDLQPHREIPCSDTVVLRSVKMRIYYSD